MSDGARKPTGAAQRGDGQDAARAAKVRRNAWLLGGLAFAFYVGYMVWMYFKSSAGG